MKKKKKSNSDSKMGKKMLRAHNTGIILLGRTSSTNLAKLSALVIG